MPTTASDTASARTRTGETAVPPQRTRRDLAKLGLGALGIVYGDIGTSPLYAIKECVHSAHGVEPTRFNVLGVVSLVFWVLVLVVCVKYLVFIMRADNEGEGGILAFQALLRPRGVQVSPRKLLGVILLLGLFGAGLLFGEGTITPAISVLSAVEGLGQAAPSLQPIILPVTLVILAALFLVQRFGTGGLGAVFGWVMLVWFAAIATAGVAAIAAEPAILAALSPHHALRFSLHHGDRAFFLLGSVVLAITGAEALYADMGHFGRTPIRFAWWMVVLPALVLCYLGQGALLLARGEAVAANPFYALARGWTIYPMIVLATAATVIASQALISGVFSLTHQAIQLGFWPRMQVVHTSGKERGQIYVPAMNTALALVCLALVVGFRTSSNLAGAYGTAVTGTMVCTSLLFFAVARTRWGWSRARAGSLLALFLSVDLVLFAANLPKLPHGGWLPLAIAAGVFTLMTTWRAGRSFLAAEFKRHAMPADLFLEDVARTRPHRVPGMAVFMTSNTEGVPPVLLHHLKHNKVLHEKVVLLSAIVEHVPKIRARDRATVADLGQGFYRVVLRTGFMQEVNVPDALGACRKLGLPFDPPDTSYFLGRETLLTSGRAPLARWRKAVFSFMNHNLTPATAFFRLPPNRVVELGTQIQL